MPKLKNHLTWHRSSGKGSTYGHSDPSSDETGQSSHHSSRPRMKLERFQSFDGRTKWSTWYNQFEDATEDWSSKDKLRELKKLLRGEAADFVFDQLRPRIRDNFYRLREELANRFQKTENPKTYGALFNKKKQGISETVEDFAHELKRLYDKAYLQRDRSTRREDLLRRFFEGLNDQNAAHEVEFVKDIQDIDEAVEQIIMYQQIHKTSRKAGRTMDDDESSDDEVRAIAGKFNGRRPPRNFREQYHKPQSCTEKPGQPETAGPSQGNSQPANGGHCQCQTYSLPVATEQTVLRPTEGADQGVPGQNHTSTQGQMSRPLKPGMGGPKWQVQQMQCWHCGDYGHLKNNCSHFLNQMSVQPGMMYRQNYAPQNTANGFVQASMVPQNAQLVYCPDAAPSFQNYSTIPHPNGQMPEGTPVVASQTDSLNSQGTPQ